jgi:ABC-type uncharacterized transport system ATPase subunit
VASLIALKNLSMSYLAPVREAGLQAAVRSLFKREYRAIPAVQDMAFSVDAGEVVGFIGPNGAGKTTTLKMLSGILHPTSGEALVLGCVPWKREPAFLRQIAMVRGSQPIGGPGELTVMDSLRFQQLIYEIPASEFRTNLAELVELLDLEQLLTRQIRALSLGERMRAGLALALVYRPKVLFLDEPTIGLDVSAVGVMRRFIASYSATTGATILLTSHYMADVETLCKRIILIDKGKLAYDGDLSTLATTLSPYKLIKVAFAEEHQPELSAFGQVISTDAGTVSLRVDRGAAPVTIAKLLSQYAVADLSVTDPPLETVIDQIYQEGLA